MFLIPQLPLTPPQSSGLLGVSPGTRLSAAACSLSLVREGSSAHIGRGMALRFLLCLASVSSKSTVSCVVYAPPGLGVKTHHPFSGRAVASDLRSTWPPRASSTPWCCSSLGEAWAQVKKSLADEAEVHLKFSAKVSPPWVGPTHRCAAERLTTVSPGCGVAQFPWCKSRVGKRCYH